MNQALPNSRRTRSFAVGSALLVVGLLLSGCATGKQTGALAGAGLGGIIGGAAGGTKYAVIGSAAGAGVGYLIGNKKDKDKAEKMARDNEAARRAKELHDEVGDLGGTRWNVISLEPAPEAYVLKVVEFDNSGHVTSTTTVQDGDQIVRTENYRVVGNTLIINQKGVLINARFSMSGNRMTVTADTFHAVLERI